MQRHTFLKLARLALVSTFFLSVCAQVPRVAAEGTDVDASWKNAFINMSDGSPFPPTEKKVPVVLYMHGCAGLSGRGDNDWVVLLNIFGFAVIRPNSLARNDRGPTCRGGTDPSIYDVRQEELEYALKKIRALDWVDQRNIFLMGYSEGGIAVAREKSKDLAGVIISSWTCTAPISGVDGLFTDKNVPVLTMVYEYDEWFSGTRYDGSCGNKFNGRQNAESIVFPGRGHPTHNAPGARDAVERFLKRNLR